MNFFMLLFFEKITILRKSLLSLRPKKENILGPTQTFLKTFGILKSIFRLFLRIFIFFFIQKVFIKKVCRPTDPKNDGHVTGNKTYFSLGLNEKPEITGSDQAGLLQVQNFWGSLMTPCLKIWGSFMIDKF